MISRKDVQGSQVQAVPLVVGKDTVYVHTNIVQATNADGTVIENLWQYDEVQYGKDEYINLLSSQLTDVQLAITQLYERSAI